MSIKEQAREIVDQLDDNATCGVCQGSCRLVSKSTQPDFLYQG